MSQIMWDSFPKDIPDKTPRYIRRASSAPLINSIVIPIFSLTLLIKSLPLGDSLTALVAAAKIFETL